MTRSNSSSAGTLSASSSLASERSIPVSSERSSPRSASGSSKSSAGRLSSSSSEGEADRAVAFMLFNTGHGALGFTLAFGSALRVAQALKT